MLLTLTLIWDNVWWACDYWKNNSRQENESLMHSRFVALFFLVFFSCLSASIWSVCLATSCLCLFASLTFSALLLCFVFFVFAGDMSFFLHESSVLSSPNILNVISGKYGIFATLCQLATCGSTDWWETAPPVSHCCGVPSNGLLNRTAEKRWSVEK